MAAEPTYIHSANQETFKSDPGDALLTSFSLLLQHYGITRSEEVLVAGLPIKERITPELLIRVADSNGCKATVKQRGLQEISDLLLPVLLELRDQQACVFLKRLDDKRAVVFLPETGMQEIVVDLTDLRDEYAGRCYFVKPELRRDERSGIEVKAAATVSRRDFAGLRLMRDRLGDRFVCGVVLHCGEATIPIGERLWAIPLEGLWTT